MRTLDEIERDKQQLISLISKLSKFGQDGPVVAESRDELADLIQSNLREFTSNIQLLEVSLVDGSRKEKIALDKLREESSLLHLKFRKAQVQSKKNLEKSWKEQRELLLKGASDSEAIQKSKFQNMSVEDRALYTSKDITSVLQRINQMAQMEVVKSSINIEELDESTKNLEELHNRYTAFDVLLVGSQKLVKHLEAADSWDRKCMIASMSLLALVVLWIVWRRLLKAPTLFLFWIVGQPVMFITSMFGLGNKDVVIMSSASAGATTTIGGIVDSISTRLPADPTEPFDASETEYLSPTIYPDHPEITDQVNDSYEEAEPEEGIPEPTEFEKDPSAALESLDEPEEPEEPEEPAEPEEFEEPENPIEIGEEGEEENHDELETLEDYVEEQLPDQDDDEYQYDEDGDLSHQEDEGHYEQTFFEDSEEVYNDDGEENGHEMNLQKETENQPEDVEAIELVHDEL